MPGDIVFVTAQHRERGNRDNSQAVGSQGAPHLAPKARNCRDVFYGVEGSDALNGFRR